MYFVYILTTKDNHVLYTGITNNIARRMEEHKAHSVKGFTQKYNVTKLVYYEVYETIEYALAREKQLKAGPRKRKVKLVECINPGWQDLSEDLS